MSATEPGRQIRWVRGARLAALGLLTVAVVVRLWDPSLLELLRLRTFDLMQRVAPREAPPDVVVVALDEASLERYGQWPWPRHVVGQLVERLAEGGVAVVGIDVLFAEPDRGTPPAAGATSPLGPRAGDLALAAAMREVPVVVGESGLVEPLPSAPPAPPLSSVVFRGGNGLPYLITFRSTVATLDVLRREAAGAGIFSLAAEEDGVVRRVPLIIGAGSAAFPSLALEVLRVHDGRPLHLVEVDAGGLRGVRLGDRLVPTDGRGRLWLHYARFDADRLISAADLLAGEVPAERLGGRIALIGASATGLGDIRATPLGVFVPGVEVHAQILDTLMADAVLRRPAWLEVAEIGVTIGASLLLILLLPLAGPRWTLAVLALTLALVAAGSIGAFVQLRMLVDPFYPSVVALAIFLLLSYLALTAEARQRQQIRRAFDRYLSPTLVARLSEEPQQLRLGGETRDLTLLFADVRGFTSLSEVYGDDPAGLTRLLNRLLTPMTDAILESGGTVDKYLGDGVMAFWNAPLDDPRHGESACRAALAMRAGLARLNEEIAADGGHDAGAQALLDARRALERGDAPGGTAAAIDTLNRLAERGSAEAQYHLGRAYRDGRGVEPNPARAARWFRASAVQGFGRAQRNLGLRFLTGDGLPADLAEAYVWLSLAADAGFETEAVPLLPLRNRLTAEQRRLADAKLVGWQPVVSDIRNMRLEMGLGLASGSCTVGNLGSERRFDYSALGDPVNLAARLEAQTRRYGVDVIAAETTVERAPDLAFLEIDLLQVSGRRAVTRIYTLLGDEQVAKSDAFERQVEAHRAFLDVYRDRQWAEAERRARALAQDYVELRELYGTYLARLERYAVDPPPPDWDGAYRAPTK